MDKYQELSIFVCGSDHADKQALCEDYSAFRKDDHFSVIAVSSGGNESQYFRSYVGARFAVEAALDSLTAFASSVTQKMLFADKRAQARLLSQLEGSILVSWNDKVNRHLENYPFREDELNSVESEKHRQGYQEGVNPNYAYRANVTAAVVTDTYCLIIRNGNGECLLLEKGGQLTEPLPVTRREDAYALCRPNAVREFSYCCSDAIPSSIFLVTDGVRRCFAKQEDYHAYLRELTQMLLRNPGDAKEYLKADLPMLSQRGSRDDMCLAAVWSSERLREGPAHLWKKDVEWERDAEWKRIVNKKTADSDQEQKHKEAQRAAQQAADEAGKAAGQAQQAAQQAAAEAGKAAQVSAVNEIIKAAQQTSDEAQQAAQQAAEKAMTAAQQASDEAGKASLQTAEFEAVKAAQQAAEEARAAARQAADEAGRAALEARKASEEALRSAQEMADEEARRIEAEKAQKKKQASLFKKLTAAAAVAAVAVFLFGGKGDSGKQETTAAETSLEDKVETTAETPDAEKESRERAELEESIRESIREESLKEAMTAEEETSEETSEETEEEITEEETMAEETSEEETRPPETTAAPRTTAAPPQTTAPPQTAPPETAPPETAPPETNPPQPETPPAPPQTQPPETTAPPGQSDLDAASQLLRPLQ